MSFYITVPLFKRIINAASMFLNEESLNNQMTPEEEKAIMALIVSVTEFSSTINVVIENKSGVHCLKKGLHRISLAVEKLGQLYIDNAAVLELVANLRKEVKVLLLHLETIRTEKFSISMSQMRTLMSTLKINNIQESANDGEGKSSSGIFGGKPLKEIKVEVREKVDNTVAGTSSLNARSMKKEQASIENKSMEQPQTKKIKLEHCVKRECELPSKSAGENTDHAGDNTLSTPNTAVNTDTSTPRVTLDDVQRALFKKGIVGESIRKDLMKRYKIKPPFVGLRGLNYSLTKQELNNFFIEKNLHPTKVVLTLKKDKPSGYGYVQFGTQNEAINAIRYNCTNLKGRHIEMLLNKLF